MNVPSRFWVLGLLVAACPVFAAGDAVGHWGVELSPLTSVWRWDSNVLRLPGGSRGDTLWNFSTGAEATLLPKTGNFWEGRLDYFLSTAAYGRVSMLDNVQNDFGLTMEMGPEPYKLTLSKLYCVRRSRLAAWDYWDDGYRGEIRWSDPDSRSDLGFRLEQVSRSFFGLDSVLEAQEYHELHGVGNGDLEILRTFTLTGKVDLRTRDYNRYAVGEGLGGLWIEPDLQTDHEWSGELGFRWFRGSFLQQAHYQWGRLRSNSVGFADRFHSISWAGVWHPGPKLYLEGLARSCVKRYDRTPLALPEYDQSWFDEDGQTQLSLRGSELLTKGWKVGLGFSWIRAESILLGQYYEKRRADLSLQKSF